MIDLVTDWSRLQVEVNAQRACLHRCNNELETYILETATGTHE
jgi:hypothetical protein